MNRHLLHPFSFARIASALLFTYSFFLGLTAPGGTAFAASPGAVTPYTFLGRVMDSHHAAFDTNRVCTLAVRDGTSGDLLVETTTFFRPGLRRNYVLAVPVSTSKAAGFAVQGEALSVAATDDLGNLWEGVIPGALCGEAAGIREVDIVLGADANGNGIDDRLETELRTQWETGRYWVAGEEFDPTRDYDGDGVATLDEAYSGTDPFNPDDALRITAMTLDNVASRSSGASDSSLVTLSFPAVPGRAYSVQTVSDLSSDNWTSTSFTLPDDDTAATTVSIPSNAKAVNPVVVYLLPSTNSAAFFRIRLE